jgi:protein-S-isoprenylcysteine O-methyltransferase Ste14
VRLIIFLGLMALLLFGTSGHTNWMAAWVLLSVFLALMSLNLRILITTNPDVVAERMKREKSSRKKDLVVAAGMMVFWLASLVTAGLDERFGWSPETSLALTVFSVVLIAMGDLLFLWAMSVNRFFTRAVRIQRERGHAVVASGPYRSIRHPGYAGGIMMTVAVPLILGSLWALLPAAFSILFMSLRTSLEDAMLRHELDGYADYARKVHYRLLPGIW